ncbi:MAG: phosphopantetheine-binding protein [Planctomycetaceae bacterium]|jgi:acyl carrier protein|nr:phosphopantetheine-binding protein [Planctomycetaceae bacterium]
MDFLAEYNEKIPSYVRRWGSPLAPAEVNSMVSQSSKVKIVEFDATAARRNKMRSQAESRIAHASPQVQSAPPPVSHPQLDETTLKKFLIEFVVEQTGYPEEIVELDADLEGDLGIDSIKKAQLFGELNERFEIQVQGNLSLDDFPTLRHIMDYLVQHGRKRGSPSPASEAAKPVAAPTVSTPPSPAPPSTSAKLDGTTLKKFLIEFVVEQTGYPEEIVELDADLEGDLGIDSIKKAQLFGELNERFEIQVQGNLSLDDFPTLRHVMDFLLQHGRERGSASSAVPQKAASSAPPSITAKLDEITLKKFLIEFVVEQTGYPEEIVELDADLEGDLGIDSIKKAQLFGELNERFEIQVQGNLSLDDFPTLRHIMDYLIQHARQR